MIARFLKWVGICTTILAVLLVALYFAFAREYPSFEQCTNDFFRG